MISSNFAKYLHSFPNVKKFFKGIFAADTIPKTLKVNHFLICNTDTANGNGKHWYCVIRTKTSEIECFDSLGIDQPKRIFLQNTFNFKGIRKIKFNCTPVQSPESSTCGHFVLYFLINRMYNKDLGFSDLLNDIFESDTYKNEEAVTTFFQKHFNENG